MTTLQIQLDAIKFLPQSVETNRPNPRERRGEEKEFLLGAFEGATENGTQDAKKLVRCWFSSSKDQKAAWRLWTEERRGVLVVGKYKESDTDYDNKTLSMSDCYLPRYGADGKFNLKDEEGKEVVFEGKAGDFVSIKVEATITLKAAPTLGAKPASKPLSLKAKHREIEAAQKEAAGSAPVTAPVTPGVID